MKAALKVVEKDCLRVENSVGKKEKLKVGKRAEEMVE